MDPTILSVVTISGTSVAAIAAVASFAYWRGKDMGKAEAEQNHGIDIAKLQEHEGEQDRRLDEGSEKFDKILDTVGELTTEVALLTKAVNGKKEG